MATYIKTMLDKDGNVIVPRTRIEAVYLDDGITTLDSRLDTIEESLASITPIEYTASDGILLNSSNFSLDATYSPTFDALTLNDTLKINGENVTSYTPFAGTFFSGDADINTYKVGYLQNQNSGSDASADFAAYNDLATGLDTYYIDMGMNSSNYSSEEFPIFPANSGYLFTGGVGGSYTAPLYLGTESVGSDVVIFTGGVEESNIDVTIKDNGNVLIGTINDTGYKLNVNGSVNFNTNVHVGGAIYAEGDITSPSQLVTKAYVDNASSTGIHIHEPVRVEQASNWTVAYTDGGTVLTIISITDNSVLTSDMDHNLLVDDVIYFTSTTNGLSSTTPYFIYSTPASNTFTLASQHNGDIIDTLTNGNSLTITGKANTGVGATLINAGTKEALVIDGIELSYGNRVAVVRDTDKYQNGIYTVSNIGSESVNWVLTRSNDENKYSPSSINGISNGDYFYVLEGDNNAGESYVVTTLGPILFGVTDITLSLFSSAVDYNVVSPLNLTGNTLTLNGIVDAVNGGTGVNSVTNGDILYGSSTDTWSKLSVGNAYQSLSVNASGTNVYWSGVQLNQSAAVSGELSINNGGTGSNTAQGALDNLGASSKGFAVAMAIALS